VTRRIAALYVQSGGCYFGLEGVDPWDKQRDARNYPGPDPVVAHPPCQRWCRLAGLVEKRWGHRSGEDGGTFASALHVVRMFGGVLEHPAFSAAWPAFALTRPPRAGGWVRADTFGGYTCHVEQSRYGHVAKKATWLYAARVQLPDLLWGSVPDREITARVSWCGNRVWSGADRRCLSSREASATPHMFRDVLISTARSAA